MLMPAKKPDRLSALSKLDIREKEGQGVSTAHVSSLRSRWSVVLSKLPRGITAGGVTYDKLMNYVALRRKESVRGQTIVREIDCVKRALKIAKRKGYIEETIKEWPKIRRDRRTNGARASCGRHPKSESFSTCCTTTQKTKQCLRP